VLVSQVYPDEGYKIDPVRLAKLLAGTAIVYKSNSSEVDEELDNLLGERLGCRRGAIRIYFPGVHSGRTGDERRHRFILPKDVESWGIDQTIEIIVKGIARRGTRPKGVLTPLDVEGVKRQRRLAQLRAEQSDTSKDELMRLFEEENQSLNNANAQLEKDKIGLEDRVEEFGDEIRRLEYEKDSLKANLAQVGSPPDERDLKVIRQRLKRLPNSLPEVVDLIREIHPARIAFTERAIKSASERDFSDVHTAWRVLWAMATTLYDMFFEQHVNNIPRAFREQSGFELAMTEGKLTNQDKKLTAWRNDVFEGQKIDITPHVKFDKDTTRAYFCPFRANGTKRIVVGHIGHFDTAGTRRRK
jgi:hypothetical protein